MSEKSSAALEREAEAVRSQVANTADSLRDKMSPGQMMDEVRDYFSNSDGSVALNNLKAQVRDNPLPLALIGAGLAWFFLGGGPSADRLRRSRLYGHSGYVGHDDFDDDFSRSSYTDDDWDSGMEALGGFESSSSAGSGASGSAGSKRGSMTGKIGSMASGLSDKAGSAASGMSDRAGSMASDMSDRASGMASSVSDAAGSAYSAVSGTASSAAHAASAAARRAARTGRMLSKESGRVSRRVHDGYVDILAREPLVLGALGLAVGTAIGAMLPRTEYEDENLGPYRDRLRDEAGKRVSEGIDEAKDLARDVAENTYKAAKGEADKQGLVPDKDQSLTDRVSKVASTAASTAESSVRNKIEPSKSQS